MVEQRRSLSMKITRREALIAGAGMIAAPAIPSASAAVPVVDAARIVAEEFWTGKDAPTLAERAKNLPKYQASNRRAVSREFYRSVFTRDHSGAAEPMLGDVIADLELQYGDSVPTGTYVDMTTKLPVVDPLKV